jgi:hypothetical protein
MKVLKIWSPKSKQCANCRTTEHPHRAKGYCKRCYPLQLKLQYLKRWDLSKPETLKGFLHSLLLFVKTQQEVDAFKVDAKNQIKRRLYHLRLGEEKLKGIIVGIDIEHKLETIARMIAPRSSTIYHGVADLIDQNFNDKQKKVIYILLSKIDEALPWKGIRIGQHAAKAMVRTFIDSCGQ